MNKSRRRAVQKHRAKEHKFQTLRKNGQATGGAVHPHAAAPQNAMARPIRPTSPTPAPNAHAEAPAAEVAPVPPAE